MRQILFPLPNVFIFHPSYFHHEKIFIYSIILLVLLNLGCSKNQAAKPKCKENDWNCFCAGISYKDMCEKYPDCTWTNFHSNEFYCMETFCITYNEEECKKHAICMWVYSILGNSTYCEGAEYFDETRHRRINTTIWILPYHIWFFGLIEKLYKY